MCVCVCIDVCVCVCVKYDNDAVFSVKLDVPYAPQNWGGIDEGTRKLPYIHIGIHLHEINVRPSYESICQYQCRKVLLLVHYSHWEVTRLLRRLKTTMIPRLILSQPLNAKGCPLKLLNIREWTDEELDL